MGERLRLRLRSFRGRKPDKFDRHREHADILKKGKTHDVAITESMHLMKELLKRKPRLAIQGLLGIANNSPDPIHKAFAISALLGLPKKTFSVRRRKALLKWETVLREAQPKGKFFHKYTLGVDLALADLEKVKKL